MVKLEVNTRLVLVCFLMFHDFRVDLRLEVLAYFDKIVQGILSPLVDVIGSIWKRKKQSFTSRFSKISVFTYF